MGAAERKKPYLAAVREGNPGRRPLDPGVILPAGELPEPDWAEVFPSSADPVIRGENVRARHVASAEWRRVVPVLVRSAGLADVDLALTRDYCVCVARLDQGERSISRQGAVMEGERGWQKNGWSTLNSQYRAQLKIYVRELGLSPSARRGISPPEADDPDDPFA